MRLVAVLLALVLLTFPCDAAEGVPDLGRGSIQLPSGETVSIWGALSYNKLRRGTAIEFRYVIWIYPAACFLVAEDGIAGHRALKLEINSNSSLVPAGFREKGETNHSIVKGKRISNCSSAADFKATITASPDQSLGMQRISGRIIVQPVNSTGILPPQIIPFEFPIEVVEHGDRTVKYNENYGFRPSIDLLWRLPAFPFYAMYCLITGGACD